MKITIEGAQGEGKSLLARELFQKLHMSGKEVVVDDAGSMYGTHYKGSNKKADILIIVNQTEK